MLRVCDLYGFNRRGVRTVRPFVPYCFINATRRFASGTCPSDMQLLLSLFCRVCLIVCLWLGAVSSSRLLIQHRKTQYRFIHIKYICIWHTHWTHYLSLSFGVSVFVFWCIGGATTATIPRSAFSNAKAFTKSGFRICTRIYGTQIVTAGYTYVMNEALIPPLSARGLFPL